MNSLGVCIFDNPDAPQDGYISIDGADAVKIRGANELSNNVLWVTNLNFNQFKRERFYQNSNMKDNQYFRTSLDIMQKELGVVNSDPAVKAQMLSAIGSRIVSLSNKLLGTNLYESHKEYRFSNEIKNAIFPDELKGYESLELIPIVKEASRHATQNHQAMSGSHIPRGSTTYGFYFPRTEYARYLMKLPMPCKNDWREITFKSRQFEIGTFEGKKIKGTDEAIATLMKLSESRAIMLKIEVNYMDPFYAKFGTFSAGLKEVRSWATLPEVIELSRYARISVFAGISCSIGRLNVLDAVLNEIEIEFSYSRGILLENAWVALSIGYGDMRSNFLSAYIRAYDRIVCGKAAASFADKFVVGSYGTGRVTLYLNSGDVEAANNLAESLGLMKSLKGLDDNV